MIEVKNLNKFYGGVLALKNLSFELGSREILGFLGPNGAGKTTALQIMTGYLSANSGTVRVGGYDIVREGQKARKQIGYLPESVPLYEEETPQSYLNFRAKLKGVFYRDRSLFLQEVIEKCELGDVLTKRIETLSKGYRQRVGLADALIAKPPILLLDEPTEGLDPLQKRALIRLIQQLQSEHTVLFSTHILSEATQLCSKILILHQGKRLAFNTVEKLQLFLYQGLQRFSARIQGKESEIQKHLALLEGVERVEWVAGHSDAYWIWVQEGSDPREYLFDLCVKKGFKLLELAPLAITLEEIFVKLIEREEEKGETVP
jgi:ABC-2 type transport system ATP-binding protein